eukprot:GHVP01031613.1.p1 GENE.GHVP01031613.1~~GHVP01031613.1.p1  ORF type:complete len:196 (-),score=38.79 GHVP01031613.1:58-609(-)
MGNTSETSEVNNRNIEINRNNQHNNGSMQQELMEAFKRRNRSENRKEEINPSQAKNDEITSSKVKNEEINKMEEKGFIKDMPNKTDNRNLGDHRSQTKDTSQPSYPKPPVRKYNSQYCDNTDQPSHPQPPVNKYVNLNKPPLERKQEAAPKPVYKNQAQSTKLSLPRPRPFRNIKKIYKNNGR